jgi:hypothetical protein
MPMSRVPACREFVRGETRRLGIHSTEAASEDHPRQSKQLGRTRTGGVSRAAADPTPVNGNPYSSSGRARLRLVEQ